MIIWLMWSHENAALLAAAHRIDPDGVPTSFVAGDEVDGNDPKLRTAAAAAEFGGRGITVADSFDGFLYASHGRQPKTGRHDHCRGKRGRKPPEAVLPLPGVDLRAKWRPLYEEGKR